MPEQAPFSASAPPSAKRHRPIDDAMAQEGVNPQKYRTSLSRVWHVTGYSIAGLRVGWGEAAFRQEAIASAVLIPAAFWLGRSWVEIVLLAGAVSLS